MTGKNEITQAAAELFSGNCSVILYSMGKDGGNAADAKGQLYRSESGCAGERHHRCSRGHHRGAAPSAWAEQDITKENVNEVTMEQWQAWLEFAVYYANYSVMGSGAITSYPDRETFIRWKQQMQQKG